MMTQSSVILPEFLSRLAAVADDLGHLLDALQQDVCTTGRTAAAAVNLQNLDKATQTAREISRALTAVSEEIEVTDGSGFQEVNLGSIDFHLGSVETFMRTGKKSSEADSGHGELELF